MLRKFWSNISYVGISPQNLSFNGQRLVIFNQLIFLAITASIIRLAVISFSNVRDFSIPGFLINIAPIVTCLLVSFFNNHSKFTLSRGIAFFVLPQVFLFISITQQDYSLASLYPVFGVLSFFFINRETRVRIVYLLLAVCYIGVKVVEFHDLRPQAPVTELLLVVFNCGLTMILLFLLLGFIRKVMYANQHRLHLRTQELQQRNKAYEDERLRVAEKEALLEEKNASLLSAVRHNNKMMAIISHDLRTPVVSVKNVFDLYEKGIIGGNQLLDYMPEVNREMAGVIDLLENLLQWSKQQTAAQSQKPEIINVHELVGEVMNLYQLTAYGKNIILDNATGERHNVYADKQMVKVVLRNMISNAVKFTDAGGCVSVQSKLINGAVMLSVNDEGVGMTHAQVEKIMNGEMFTTKGTANETGTGLGLSLSREFVTRNKGSLVVDSTPGKGTCFHITLPVAPGISLQQPDVLKVTNAPVVHIQPSEVLRPAKSGGR
jgi:two-component system, sensor histidine kinase and response regulator